MASIIACYLLTSTVRPHYRKKTYVGFTDDPARRVEEHNGKNNRGAVYTEDYRPWIPVCVVQVFSSPSIAQKFEYAWQHPHSSKYVRKWWDTNEPPRHRGHRKRRVTPGVGTPCSVRHKLLEMNLLLWLRGDDIPWGNDRLSLIYTSERSLKWARELGQFSRLPPHVRKWIWPISDLAHLVRLLDPDIEPALLSDEAVGMNGMDEVERVEASVNKSTALRHTTFESQAADSRGMAFEYRVCRYCECSFAFKGCTSLAALRHLKAWHPERVLGVQQQPVEQQQQRLELQLQQQLELQLLRQQQQQHLQQQQQHLQQIRHLQIAERVKVSAVA